MMKALIFIFILSLLVIGSCKNPNNTQLPSSSKITEESGNELRVEMYMFTGPEFIKQTDRISLKFIFTNLGNINIDGLIKVEDTPDTSQFGGIEEPAEINFNLKPETGKSNVKEIIVPGTTDIEYKIELNFTSFLAIIDYNVKKTINTENFCIKYSSTENIQNCNFRGTVKTKFSNLVNGFEYEYADSNGDNINDRMTLKFDINERCSIKTEDEQLIKNFELSLKNIGTIFDCSIDKKLSTNNHKTIRCTNIDDLQITSPYYQEGIVAKFKYDCNLLLKSGFIDLNKGG